MKTIEQQNTMIADFMGLTKAPRGFFVRDYIAYEPSDLQYHTSWDWLMPVLDKIENEGLKCNIGITSCTIYSAKYNVETVYSETKIKATYNAVCQFIEWYNANK